MKAAGLVCQACAGDAPRGKCLNPKCVGGPIVRELVPSGVDRGKAALRAMERADYKLATMYPPDKRGTPEANSAWARFYKLEFNALVYPMETVGINGLTEAETSATSLPEMDVYHDQHPFGGDPESFSEDRMREYGELCARMAREEERARIESSDVVQFLYGAGELDGVGYSEVPIGKPRYWWRSILRATIKG